MPACFRLLQTGIFPQNASQPPLHAERVEIVWVRLDQHRHVQPRELERLGNALLVAEVRQDDQHAVDLVAPRREELGTPPRLGERLHAAQLAVLLVEHDRLQPGLAEKLQHISPGFADERVGKEVAVADDDA